MEKWVARTLAIESFDGKACHMCFHSVNSPDWITSSKTNIFRSLWWWPLWVWPKTLWEATIWTCCSLWDSLGPGCTVARTLPVLDTSSPCWGRYLPLRCANILKLQTSCLCSDSFVSFQLSRSPCFSTCGRQFTEVQLRWQSTRRARVVYTHHSHGASQWCWRDRHWLGQQNPKLRRPRNRQQHPPHAEWWWASAHGEHRPLLCLGRYIGLFPMRCCYSCLSYPIASKLQRVQGDHWTCAEQPIYE